MGYIAMVVSLVIVLFVEIARDKSAARTRDWLRTQRKRNRRW